MEFPELRNALQRYLHQDYDLDSGTTADCIFNAVKNSDLPKLRSELRQLASCDDATIHRVLDDHEVDIWDGITPRDLLCTLRTLAELFRESPYDDPPPR